MGSPDYFINIFKASPLPSLLLKPDGPKFTIKIPNTAYLNITGTTEADLIGKGIFEAFPDNPDNPLADGVKNLRASLERAIQTKMPHKMAVQRYDIPIRGTQVFEQKYYDPENVPVLDDEGNVAVIIHTVTDITEKILLQKKQLQLEEYAGVINTELENLKKASATGSWELELETNTLFWSDELYRLYGFEPGMVVPTVEKWLGLVDPADRERTLLAQKQIIEKGITYPLEIRATTATGEKMLLLNMAFAVKNTEGKVIKVTGITQKVIASTLMDTMLRESIVTLQQRNEFIETILQNLPVGIAINKISDGKPTLVNKQFKELYGWDESDMADMATFLEKVYPDKNYREELARKVLADIISGDPQRLQWNGLKITTKAGEKRIVNAKNILLSEQDVMISTRIDITEREDVLQQLKESNLRYYYLTKATTDAIWDWDIANNTIFWGEGLKTGFGYDQDEIASNISSWAEHIHPQDAERVYTSLQAFISGREAKWEDQYRYFKADKTMAYVIDKGFVIRNEQGKAIRMVGGMRDITLRKEEELRIKLLQSVVTNTNDSVLITEAEPFDEPGPRIIYVNDAFTKMTGYTAEEVMGKSPRILQGPKTDQNELKSLSTALRKWESCEATIINYKKNGEEFWIQMSISPVADETGLYTHWVSIERDVTAQKNEELQKLLLAEISQLFNSTATLNSILRKVMQRFTLFQNFSLAEVWLVARDHESIDKAAIFKQEHEENGSAGKDEITSYSKGQGLPGYTWEEKELQVWNSIENNKPLNAHFVQKYQEFKTIFSLPLIHNNEVVGVFILGIGNKAPSTGTPNAFFETLSLQMGAEIKRKQLEQELDQIFNHAPDIICMSAMNGYFVKVNPAMSRILGYTEEELLNTPYTDFLHPDDRNVSLTKLERLEKGNPVFLFENRYLTKSGKTVWLSWTATSLVDEKLSFGIAKDITDKKDLEHLLNKANSLARIGGWELDLLNNKLYWSDITREIHEAPDGFGVTTENGTQFYKEGVSRQTIVEKFTDAVRHGTPWDEELEIITLKGNEKWVRVIGETEWLNDKCIRVYGSFQDIDARKRAELAVIKTLEEKNTILESIGDAFFAVDKNWVVTYWNNQAEKVLHTSKSKILGHNLWQIFYNSVGSASYKKYHEAVYTNQAVHFEDYFAPLDKWYDISAYPAENGLTVYSKDITERKTFERKQKEAAAQQSLFVSIVNSSDDAIISKTLDSIITSWNTGAEKLFGYTQGEAIGKHISIIIPQASTHEEQDIIALIKNGEYVKHYETERVKKDGSRVNVSLTVSPVINPDGEIIGASKIARDITEKKKAEDEIRLSNERYNLVAKATNDSIWDWDIVTGKLTRTGDGFSKMFGYTIEQSNADNLFWTKLVHPEDITRVLDLHVRVFNNPATFYWEDEYRFLKANGQYAYVYDKGYIIRDENGKAIRMIGATQDITQQKEQVIEITRIQQNLYSLINNTRDMIWSINTEFKIIAANKAYSDAMQMYTARPTIEGDNAILDAFGPELVEKWTGLYTKALAGESFTIEETVVHPVTGESWFNIVSYSPIISKEGKITGAACFAKDITERFNHIKAIEKQNEKLREIAWIQSHIVRAPLARMIGIVNLIKELKTESQESESLLGYLVDSCNELDNIIRDIANKSNKINIG
jgi:PAS domain S-box-containing protein